uniref:Uncharacterized protein n=1 Tax=Anguilla anguilla TaxID=7936 RepID=A0A0E9VFJ6_ANGAN
MHIIITFSETFSYTCLSTES